VTSWSAESAFWITTRDRAVTDDADEFTTRRIFIRPLTVPVGITPTLPSWTVGGRTAELRPMNVVVCVKQIPDPAEPGQLDPATKTLKRDGKLILDESDSYGVEMALQLVAAAGGGEVSLVSMAPNGEVSGLRTALAMGAASAVLVSDPALQGTDAPGTARSLLRSGARTPIWCSPPPSRATATRHGARRSPRSSACRR
jgi:electron transfer flavoprotein beta subunit